MASPLQRKLGPMPVWGWLAAVGLGAILYLRARSANSSSSQTGGVGDPNAVDPTTGLTYGQEAQLALGYGGSQLTPTTGASTDGTGGGPTWTDVIGGWQDIAGAWRDIATSNIQGPAGAAGSPGAPGTPGSGAGTKPGTPKTPKLRGKGAILAPSGAKKPSAPAGYHDVGLGHGGWEFLPNKPKSTGAKTSSQKRAPAHSNEKTAHNEQPHTPPPPARTRVSVKYLSGKVQSHPAKRR